MKSMSRILLTILALGAVPCVAAEQANGDMDKGAQLRAYGRDNQNRENPCPTTRYQRVRQSANQQQKANNNKS